MFRKFRTAQRKAYSLLANITGSLSDKFKELELRSSVLYLPVEFFNTVGSFRPTSTQEKFSNIENVISEKFDGTTNISVLDLGCNEGYFSLKLGARGLWVTGIDGDPKALAVAQYLRRRYSIEKTAFYRILTDREDIEQLPTFDVVIFLSTFQKWCGQYGFDESLQMLEILWSKANHLMFFEMSDSLESEDKFKSTIPDMGATKNECKEYIMQMLETSTSGIVEWIGDYHMEYRSEVRSLFAIYGSRRN